MKIRSMHLKNYRCFENFDIDFDDRLTVLVGVNGAGKTAALDALSLFLQWGLPNSFTPYIHYTPGTDMKHGSNGQNIAYRLKVRYPDDVNEKFEQLEYNYKNQKITVPQSISNFQRVKKLLNTERHVFVAYMAGRFISESDSVLKNNIYTPSALAAFENSFNRTIDYASTLSWFNNVDADEARAMRDNEQKTELPELKAVREALSKALLGHYERPRMLGSPPELIIYEKGTDRAFKVNQLSDGYRAVLALIMDLARRMAQARGDDYQPDESLLNSPAIVLIDEVELHLHPSWQQTVLTTLMDIFTNTQFIVTTHSPQVLTSVPSKHIRILRDGKAYTVDEQTEGAEASRLLKYIFGVEPRPKALGIVQDLDKYSKLVYGEKWDTNEAEELRKKLDEHYGRDEPELMKLDLHIENIKWERGL